MNDLPSRDSFSDADIKTLYKHGFFDEEKIIMAYVSGRLVDREKIDLDWETNPDGSLQWVRLLSGGEIVATIGMP